jgi:hypothetical protein
MISFPTYLQGLGVSLLVVVVFAVVSDLAGMNERLRRECLQMLWLFPLIIAVFMCVCVALLLVAG